MQQPNYFTPLHLFHKAEETRTEEDKLINTYEVFTWQTVRQRETHRERERGESMHKSIANTVCALWEDCRGSIKCLSKGTAGGGEGGRGRQAGYKGR